MLVFCQNCGAPNNKEDKKCKCCYYTLDSETKTYLEYGTVIAKKYEINGILGKGGFGITYKGKDKVLQREVAIKEFFPHGCTRTEDNVQKPLDIEASDFQKFKQRFHTEAKILGRIKNSNVVDIYEYTEQNKTAYIITEYVNDGTLKEYLLKNQLNEEKVRKFGFQIIDGINAIHNAGYIHCDIKSENLLIRDEVIKVIDLGSALHSGQHESDKFLKIITHGYSALEMYGNACNLNPRIDIYSFGAILFEMITGNIPSSALDRIQGEDNFQLLEQKKISDNLKSTICKCLELDPKKRFKDFHELKTMLEEPASQIISESAKATDNQILIEPEQTSKDELNRISKPFPMVLVKKGNFVMGSNISDDLFTLNSKPAHKVKITYDYYMCINKIKKAEFSEFLLKHQRDERDKTILQIDSNVVGVTYWEALEYCNWLSRRNGKKPAYDEFGNLIMTNGKMAKSPENVDGYRLPTEAEWEYAARGGHYQMEKEDSTAEELQINDMISKLWEWCYDTYNDYQDKLLINPIIISNNNKFKNKYRVKRGGVNAEVDKFTNSIIRHFGVASRKYKNCGFRIVRTNI